MRYREIVSAEFLERPNRFIAYVELMGERTKVHVKIRGGAGNSSRIMPEYIWKKMTATSALRPMTWWRWKKGTG